MLDFSQSRKFLRKFLRSRNRANRAFRALSSFLGRSSNFFLGLEKSNFVFSTKKIC